MPSIDDQPTPSSPSRLIPRTLRRRRIAILAAWLVVATAACSIVYQFAKPTYRVFRLLRLDPLVQDPYGIGSGGEPLEEFLQAEVERIASPNVMTLAGANPKAVHVGIMPGTYLIEVWMTSTNLDEATTIADAVVYVYLKSGNEWAGGLIRLEIENLEEYAGDLNSHVNELERRLRPYAGKDDVELPDGAAREPKPVRSRLTTMIEEYRALYPQIHDLKIEQAQAQAWLSTAKDGARTLGNNPDPVDERDWIDKQVRRRFLLDPEARTLAAKIQEARDQCDKARRTKPLPGDPDLDAMGRRRDALMGQYVKLWRARRPVLRDQIERSGDGKTLDPAREILEAQAVVTRLQAKQRALHSRMMSIEFNTGRHWTDSDEIALMRYMIETRKGMHADVIRRLEQLRFEAGAEPRLAAVKPKGAPASPRPIIDRRPLVLNLVAFATLALVFGCFVGVEAWSGSKAEFIPTPAEPRDEAPAGD